MAKSPVDMRVDRLNEELQKQRQHVIELEKELADLREQKATIVEGVIELVEGIIDYVGKYSTMGSRLQALLDSLD